MNYELAKELKDKGFPQKATYPFMFSKEGSLIHLVSDRNWEELATDTSIPTLSELIKACGNMFGKLEKVGNKFIAMYPMVSSPSLPDCPDFADSPEEAVALLWLELNK